MKTISSRALHIFSISLSLLLVSGCQSTASTSKANNSDLADYASKQQDYEQLLQEWQTLKPGISRLLAVESELNMLLGELEQLSASLNAAQNAPQVATAPAAPEPATTAYALANQPEPEPEPEVQSAQRKAGNYALQVASITEQHKLPEVWQQMLNKNPRLLSDLEPNFQKIHVKNTDYYRLKVGSFDTIQEASSTCSSLKAAGMSCLVVDYTGSNFSQL
jgi:cell division protein FtsN